MNEAATVIVCVWNEWDVCGLRFEDCSFKCKANGTVG